MSLRDDLKKKLQGTSKKQRVFLGTEHWNDCEFLPTQVAGLDYILSGGIAFGRLAELFGDYSVGKTLLLYVILAANQRRGGESILFESEGAYRPEFYQMIGGNPETLLIRPARTTQDVFEDIASICDAALANENKGKILIGWDSIAACSTKHLQDKGMSRADMSKPLTMSQGCSYIIDRTAESNVAIVATNQTREAIGDDYNPLNRTKTTGGRAFKFAASQRLELQFRGGWIKGISHDGGKKTETKDQIGYWIRARIEKNKLGTPFLSCDIPIYTIAGEEHPIYGTATTVGVDYYEALFSFYLDSRFVMTVNGEKRRVVVPVTANGWYGLDESFGASKFQARDWPSVVVQYPQLWNLVYVEQANARQATANLDRASDQSTEGTSTTA